LYNLRVGHGAIPKEWVSDTLEQRFWRYVRKSDDGCWRWGGYKTSEGYAHFSYKYSKTIKASRYSYELHFGPIPEGAKVLHRCDVRDCVRPDHLFLGTIADNNRDRAAKGRSAKRKPGVTRVSDLAVAIIRYAYKKGYTQAAIARALHLRPSYVGRVALGKIRKHG
jgi:hypothetical protein